MTYNVFSGTLNPTHFTSLPILGKAIASSLSKMVFHWLTERKESLIVMSSLKFLRINFVINK